MVLVVLDAPWLKGEDEWHECQCAHNVFQQLVAAEAAVTTVMANNKELHGNMGNALGQIQARCHAATMEE